MKDDASLAAGNLPRGFVWGAVRAGIKASGNPDVAVAVAPGGAVGAVIVNAGNPNCATGTPGIEGCIATCVAAAQTFGCIFDEVVPSSTGIIGVPFPAEKVVAAMPALKSAVGSTPEHAEAFARAIMTPTPAS